MPSLWNLSNSLLTIRDNVERELTSSSHTLVQATVMRELSRALLICASSPSEPELWCKVEAALRFYEAAKRLRAAS